MASTRIAVIALGGGCASYPSMKKGELWRVRLPALGGRSQYGIRPVVILADHNLPVVVIVPCTSNAEA